MWTPLVVEIINDDSEKQDSERLQEEGHKAEEDKEEDKLYNLICDEIRIYRKPESFVDYYNQFNNDQDTEDAIIINERRVFKSFENFIKFIIKII